MDYDPNEVRIVERNLNKKLEERLRQAEKEEDVLLGFMTIVEQKLPTLHFLSNIVLMIWFSQTVLSSNLREIPRSLYLIAPLFDLQPLQNIEAATDGRCPTNFEVLRLGTAPDVLAPRLKHQRFTHWKDSEVIFCGERLRHATSNSTCSKEFHKCSGYCLPSNQLCPVTGIRLIDNLNDKRIYETVFYESASNPRFYFVLSRLEGQPIIDLTTFVGETCANQFFYGDEFPLLSNFTDQLREGCGVEGTLDEITQRIDGQPYKQLLRANGYVHSEEIAARFGELQVKLYYIQKLRLDSDNHYCKEIMNRVRNLPSMLPSNPHLPSFSKMLLITSLIYMILSIVWWVANACGLQRFNKEVAIFISAVELLHFFIIKSRYSQYLAITGLTEIQNCVKNNIEALRHWEYGISNPYIFKVVVFENTVFLAFEVMVGLLLRILYH